jgi:hypothetical protein
MQVPFLLTAFPNRIAFVFLRHFSIDNTSWRTSMTSVETKVWRQADILDLLERNDAAVVRGLKLIYARQTAGEQASLSTREHNGRGFTALDAPFLSDIARKLPRYNDHMTPRQMFKVRLKLKKYWKQLLEEIETKGGSVCYTPARPKPAKQPAAEPAPQQQPVSHAGEWGAF